MSVAKLPSAPRVRGGDGPALLALSLCWILLFAIIDPWGDFPVNDDWVYGRVVQNILRGRFAFDAPASANVFLQAYWGALFCAVLGFSYDVLRLSSLILGLVGAAAFYGLMRDIGARRSVAVVAVLTLVLDPIYLTMSASFMTDVPFLCFSTVALRAFVRGMIRSDPRLVAAGFAIALATILIRQHALLFVVAFGVSLAARERLSARSVALLIVVTIAGVAIQLTYQHWLIATGRTQALLTGEVAVLLPRLDTDVLAFFVVKGTLLFPLFGLMVAPLLLLTRFAALRRLWSAHPLAVPIAFFMLVLAQVGLVAAFDLRMPYYGNMLNGYGVGPLTLRDTFIVLANQPPESAFWHGAWLIGMLLGMATSAAVLIEAVAMAGTLLQALSARGRVDGRDIWLPALAVTILILYLGLTMLMSVSHNAFDRYLMPLVLPVALLIAPETAHPDRRRPAGAAILLACFAAYSLPAVHDYFAFQRARLAATDALERTGIASARIDGGYEYSGRRLGVVDGLRPGVSYWALGNDYVVALGPLRGYAIGAVYPYARWLTWDRGRVVTLRRTSGPVDPDVIAGTVLGDPHSKPAGCSLWLAGLPTCPRKGPPTTWSTLEPLPPRVVELRTTRMR